MERDGTEYWTMQSALVGNVGALVDSSGAIQEGIKYRAYGEATFLTAPGNDGNWFTADDATAAVSSLANPYTFTGRRHDDETSLMHYRYRQYAPASGRFISRDPEGYIDGFSLYLGHFAPFGSDPLGLAWYNPFHWFGGNGIEVPCKEKTRTRHPNLAPFYQGHRASSPGPGSYGNSTCRTVCVCVVPVVIEFTCCGTPPYSQYKQDYHYVTRDAGLVAEPCTHVGIPFAIPMPYGQAATIMEVGVWAHMDVINPNLDPTRIPGRSEKIRKNACQEKCESIGDKVMGKDPDPEKPDPPVTYKRV